MTKSEKFSHYAIVLIALGAMAITAWQVHLSREHNRLSVRPYLDTFTGWQAEDRWSIQLSNNGVGPAVVTDVHYTFEGKEYGNWDAVLDAAGIRQKRRSSHNFGSRSYVPSGKTIDFLVIDRKEQDPPFGIRADFGYESIYEEPFQMSLNF